jgi:hypothetical protein
VGEVATRTGCETHDIEGKSRLDGRAFPLLG